ncbi:MAG: hypothetical protein MMC33_002597 [Icmadophila ericetorum]|nr:hypothetical protein [Icmadophila ericetorum]
MSDSVDRVFVHALSTVKKIPRTGSARPPAADRLKLYGLYKQSMEGDVEGVMARPKGDGVEEMAERDKWDAWSAQHGLSRTEAKRNYISTLIETMHKYASSTPEARELVAELEFVWDQVKANSASGSSGDGQTLANQRTSTSVKESKRSREKGEPPEYARSSTSALRLLRPASENDPEEDLDDISDEEEEEGDEEQKQEDPDNINADDPNSSPLTRRNSSTQPPYELRNRKWRKRVESSLIKLTAEVAALREQLEANRMWRRGYRKGLGKWLIWFVWASVRHVVVDALVLLAIGVWIRRKKGRVGRNGEVVSGAQVGGWVGRIVEAVVERVLGFDIVRSIGR